LSGQRSVFEAITSNNATEQNQPDAAPSIPDFFSVFLEKMNLEQQENAGAEEVSLETMSLPSVKLMTLHASKGLEFDTVFVTGLEVGGDSVYGLAACSRACRKRRFLVVCCHAVLKEQIITGRTISTSNQ
jgi:superfamily I DNA/RNA helicase